jgi:hypothetical protein
MHEYWISVALFQSLLVRYSFDSIKAQVMSGPARPFLCARDHREKYNVHVEVNQKNITEKNVISLPCASLQKTQKKDHPTST